MFYSGYTRITETYKGKNLKNEISLSQLFELSYFLKIPVKAGETKNIDGSWHVTF